MAVKILYSDVSFNADLTPKSINIQSVIDSIKNILSTTPGERLNNPTFGSNLENYLFQPIDEVTAFGILTHIVYSINRWDDRVLIDMASSVVTPYPDDNKYDVSLVCSIKGFEKELINVDFTLTS